MVEAARRWGRFARQTPFFKFVKRCVNNLRVAIRVRLFAAAATRKGPAMTRSEMLLAILAASQGRPLTPVQIQKAAFLVTRHFPGLIRHGPRYNFTPYDYGPFDQAVYSDVELLARAGEVEITRREGTNWNQYAASDSGIARGTELLGAMRPNEQDYVRRVSAWVRSLSFEDLVRAIYNQYPEMRVNSVFRG